MSLKEEASDVVRQKKKYPKKPKAEALLASQQPAPETLPVINKSDIKQYDFHSSDEDEFPQVLVLKLFLKTFSSSLLYCYILKHN